jgi:hypothetical protein
MKNLRFVLLAAFIVLLPAVAALGHSDAAKGCTAFSWDMTREFEVMGRPAKAVEALEIGGPNSARLLLDEHYSLALPPEDRARFAMAPARAARGSAPRGGSAAFTVAKSGRYRVSISSRHWIDVIADGKALESLDHQGNSQCELVRKAVEFEMPADRQLTLQLSGQDDAVVGLAITPVAVLTLSRD